MEFVKVFYIHQFIIHMYTGAINIMHMKMQKCCGSEVDTLQPEDSGSNPQSGLGSNILLLACAFVRCCSSQRWSIDRLNANRSHKAMLCHVARTRCRWKVHYVDSSQLFYHHGTLSPNRIFHNLLKGLKDPKHQSTKARQYCEGSVVREQSRTKLFWTIYLVHPASLADPGLSHSPEARMLFHSSARRTPGSISYHYQL